MTGPTCIGCQRPVCTICIAQIYLHAMCKVVEEIRAIERDGTVHAELVFAYRAALQIAIGDIRHLAHMRGQLCAEHSMPTLTVVQP